MIIHVIKGRVKTNVLYYPTKFNNLSYPLHSLSGLNQHQYYQMNPNIRKQRPNLNYSNVEPYHGTIPIYDSLCWTWYREH